MFGLGFGEILIILIVGIVVVGPRRLPTLMRTAGQWVAKLRRMSTDLRAQSGIDDLIRHEGLEEDLHHLRSLSRVNVMDSLVTPAFTSNAVTAIRQNRATEAAAPKQLGWKTEEPLREREYPLVGCDAYDAVADDVAFYIEGPAEPQAVTESPGSDAGAASEPETTS